MRKKKFLSLLLTFAMMMCLMPMKVLGEGTLNLYVTSDKSTAAPGDNITFTLKMGAVAGLTDIEFRVQVPQGLTLEENGNKVNSDFKDAMGEGGASLKVNAGVPKFTAFAETYYSNEDETTLGTLTYTVTDEVDGPVTISLIEVDANAGETKLTTTLTGAEVTITAAPVTLQGVSLNPNSANLAVNQTLQLKATLNPTNAPATVSWSSSNTNATVDNTGLVTAVNVGIATITVTATDNNNAQISYTATCSINVTECPHTNKTEIPARVPTCTEPGNNRYYYCGDCDNYLKEDGTTPTTVNDEIIPKSGHDWGEFQSDDTQHWRVCGHGCGTEDRGNHTFGEATYEWADDNSTCTAKHTCSTCNKEVTETVDATSQVSPATCTEAEKTVYTATFTKPGFTSQTKGSVETSPALDHNWDEPTYTWSADNKTCTAKRVCIRDANHKEEETVDATYVTSGNCGEPGTITYTATFSNPAFEVQTKEEETEELPHSWVEEVVQQATADLLGIIQQRCTRCGAVESSTQYLEENTCPDKCYQNDKEVYISEADIMSTEETATLDGKEVKIIVQDPLGVFAGHAIAIAIDDITSDLGADYDGNISIEQAYKANVILKVDDVETQGQLPGKVRLLLEIPDDPSIDTDNWDDEELQVQRINIGGDTEYVEGIEYQVYDADGNFVKVVEKGYVPQDGEVVRKFMVVWTDHFSQYAVIDPEDQTETPAAATTTESGASAQAKAGNGLKTGESLNEVYLAGLLLAAAILVIYLSLKKRREA